MAKPKVQITFWGVRGSMATPGASTVRFGGNTACLEIESGQSRIICDAGTGIRACGLHLMRRLKKQPIDATILLSHLHLDHYIGLPFFKPLYMKRNRFVIAGPGAKEMTFGAALKRAMAPPYFPVPFSAIPSDLTTKTLTERAFRVGDIRVKPHAVHHPGGSLGWRFTLPDGRRLVHVTDNEPDSKQEVRRLTRWMEGADVLIHDAQYTPEGYGRHEGWGHSPFTYPLTLALEAGIPHLYFFHFDPEDDDRHLREILGRARAWVRARKGRLRVDLAREGLRINL